MRWGDYHEWRVDKALNGGVVEFWWQNSDNRLESLKKTMKNLSMTGFSAENCTREYPQPWDPAWMTRQTVSFKHASYMAVVRKDTELISWSRVLLEKLTVASWSRNPPHFMVSECSLPCSQESATDPILSQLNPVHVLTLHLLKNHSNITIFEAFTAVMFQVEVFWVVMPCGVVVGYQRYRGPTLQGYTVSEPKRPWLETF
jgi:hypothetical protein